MQPSRLVGGIEIVMLEDAAGTFFAPREAAFPAASADQWAQADDLDPDAVTADGHWLLRFRCFAVHLPPLATLRAISLCSYPRPPTSC